MPNATSPFSGFEFLSKNHTNITSGVYSVLAISAALNIFTFPFAVLLNSLVIVAVKTNRRLRTKSHISGLLGHNRFCCGTDCSTVGHNQFQLVLHRQQPSNHDLYFCLGIQRCWPNMHCSFASPLVVNERGTLSSDQTPLCLRKWPCN